MTCSTNILLSASRYQATISCSYLLPMGRTVTQAAGTPRGPSSEQICVPLLHNLVCNVITSSMYHTQMAGRLALLNSFVENDCIPAESVFAREMAEIEGRTGSRWTEIPPVLKKLKAKARSLGLWNLFMPKVCLKCQVRMYSSSLQCKLNLYRMQLGCNRGLQWGICFLAAHGMLEIPLCTRTILLKRTTHRRHSKIL